MPGFTLVEMLVAMAIVAILASIAFPIFVKAKQTAQISECLSNMRQIGAGLDMYLDDNGGFFPAAVPWGSPSYWKKPENGGSKTIQELLWRYVRNGMVPGKNGIYDQPGVFACPSDLGIPREFDGLNGVRAGKPVWRYSGCSYEYYASNQDDWLNWDKGHHKVPWTGLSPEVRIGSSRERIGAPRHAVVAPTRKAVLGDTWFWHMGDQIPDGLLAWRNTLFADGHAKRVKGSYHIQARIEQLTRWHTYIETDR